MAMATQKAEGVLSMMPKIPWHLSDASSSSSSGDGLPRGLVEARRSHFWLLAGSSPLSEDLTIWRKVPQLGGVWLDQSCTDSVSSYVK